MHVTWSDYELKCVHCTFLFSFSRLTCFCNSNKISSSSSQLREVRRTPNFRLKKFWTIAGSYMTGRAAVTKLSGTVRYHGKALGAQWLSNKQRRLRSTSKIINGLDHGAQVVCLCCPELSVPTGFICVKCLKIPSLLLELLHHQSHTTSSFKISQPRQMKDIAGPNLLFDGTTALSRKE